MSDEQQEKLESLVKGLEAAATELHKRFTLDPQFRMAIKKKDSEAIVDCIWHEDSKTAVIIVTEVNDMRQAIASVADAAIQVLNVGTKDYVHNEQVDVRITRTDK